MSIIKEKMTSDFCAVLEETIRTTVRQTLESMFGCRIDLSRSTSGEAGDAVIAAVNFRQGIETIKLRLVFERSFIQSLVQGFYTGSQAVIPDEEMCNDAAGELANIICHKIKFFMNSNGFLFFVDLPVTGAEAIATGGEDDNILNLNFSMLDKEDQDGTVLCVNLA